MGAGEVIAAIALFVGMPWAVFTGIAKVKAAGLTGGRQGGGEGTELRASELRSMIESSVEEATAPLVRRIETLEAIATGDEPGDRVSLASAGAQAAGAQTAGAGRLDPATLADVFDTDLDEDDEVAAARRRARS